MDIKVEFMVDGNWKIVGKIKLYIADEEIEAVFEDLKRNIPRKEWAGFFGPRNGFRNGIKYLMSMINSSDYLRNKENYYGYYRNI